MSGVIPELVRSIRSAALNPDRWTDVFGLLLFDAGERELELTFYRAHASSGSNTVSINMAYGPALFPAKTEPPAEFQLAVSESSAKGAPVVEFRLEDEIYGIKVLCPSCDACPICGNVRDVQDEVVLSASFNRALLSGELLTSYLRGMLETLPDPALFLSADGAVVWKNAAAASEDWHEAFEAVPGKPLVLSDAAAQAAFQLALSEARKEAGTPAKFVTMVQAKTGSPALAILKAMEPSLPFKSPWVRLFQDKPQIVAVLRSKTSKPLVSSGALRQLYSLTAKEADLAIALAQGETLRDYASRTEVAFETARWHSKKLMQKMNCRSQQEILMALLYTNAVFSILK